ncbi:MAG: hypothetical protein QW561_04325 [Candidatus Aenigmatarchaeota archaeon]
MSTQNEYEKGSISLKKADILMSRCIYLLEQAALELTTAKIFLPESEKLNACKECVQAAITLLTMAYNSYFERAVVLK